MNVLTSIFSGHRPDITPAQVIGGIATAIGPACVLLGVHLSPEQLGAIDDLKLLGLGLIGGDAAIRIGRNIKDGKVDAAAVAASAQPVGDHVAQVNAAQVPPSEAPAEVDEIEDVLGSEASSDPEADAIGDDDLPSDEDEEGPQA